MNCSYRLLFLLLILSSNLSSQSFQYGIGVQTNFGYLVFDDKSLFDNTLFQPSISANLGLSLFVEVQTSKAFQIRIAGQFNQKSIQLSQKIRGTNNEKYKSRMNYLFIAADLNITAKYLIEGSAKWSYYPNLGFNIGFHKNIGYEISGSLNSETFSGLGLGLNSTDDQLFIASSIHMGLGIKPPFTIFKFPFELNCNFLYNPKRFLNNPIVVTPLVIQGKYHSLSIGLNFYLRRRKK